MKWLAGITLALALTMSSCGSGSPSTAPATQNPTMQAGQWEFVATPTTPSGKPVYVDVNLNVPDSSDFNSTVFNTLLFQFGGLVAGQFSTCGNFTISGGMLKGVMSGALLSPGSSGSIATFSGGTIASDGKSVSGGSYTATGSNTICGLAPAQSSGSFTGYTVAALNGTFSGTLTGSGQVTQVTIQATQDSNFGITASGTAVDLGVTTTLSVSPGVGLGGNSNVIGAIVEANGTATNVNGSSTFQAFGHFNPAGTQITIGVTTRGVTETGILTKQ